ncbi:MAG: rod shape-determining protein MreC [Armatimonadetes bacterium]|nr:rod shape-determining protein MreC [Armatimonadota bacterium]
MALAIVFGQFQNRARATGSVDPVSGFTRTVTLPLARAFDGMSAWFGSTAVNLTSGPGLQRELARLKDVESAAKLYADTVAVKDQTIASLRALQGFPDVGRTRVPARTVAYFAYQNQVTVSAGRDQGVTKGLPVVSAQGLLGVVQAVEADRCQVLLLTSPAVKIGAMVFRDPPVAGFLKGQSPVRLTLDVLDTNKVEVGDPVVTSGFSEKIPRGLAVGRVVQVVTDENYGIRRVYVAPAVQVGKATEVWVLK